MAIGADIMGIQQTPMSNKPKADLGIACQWDWPLQHDDSFVEVGLMHGEYKFAISLFDRWCITVSQIVGCYVW